MGNDDELPRRARQKRDARRRILDAAGRLIRSRGYAGTTMRDVARGAALSYQTLYNYFPSKGDMVRALLSEPATDLARRYETLLSNWTGELPDALDTINTLSFAIVAEGDRMLWRLASLDVLQQPESARGGSGLIDRQVHDRLNRLLLMARARGELSADVHLATLGRVLLDLADHALLRFVLNPELTMAAALTTLGDEMRLVVSPHLTTAGETD